MKGQVEATSDDVRWWRELDAIEGVASVGHILDASGTVGFGDDRSPFQGDHTERAIWRERQRTYERTAWLDFDYWHSKGAR